MLSMTRTLLGQRENSEQKEMFGLFLLPPPPFFFSTKHFLSLLFSWQLFLSNVHIDVFTLINYKKIGREGDDSPAYLD